MQLLSTPTPTTPRIHHPNRLSLRDLIHIERMFKKKYGLRIAETREGLWAMELRFEGEEDAYGLEAGRGVLRVWRNLYGAIAFVQQHCPGAAEVLVDVRGWRLMRLDERAGEEVR